MIMKTELGPQEPLILDQTLTLPRTVHCAQISAFYNAQMQAHLQPGSAGWIMWSLKMENGGIWSLQACYNGVRCGREQRSMTMSMRLSTGLHAVTRGSQTCRDRDHEQRHSLPLWQQRSPKDKCVIVWVMSCLA